MSAHTKDQLEVATMLIATQVQIASRALADAEKIAIEHGLVFHFTPTRGMGGTFYPGRANMDPAHARFTPTDAGWVSSSENC